MISGFSKGLRFLQEQQNEQAEKRAQQSNKIFKLWLKENETAKIYFVTDAEDLLIPNVHLIEVNKKSGGVWKKDVLCEKATPEDDDEKCQYCTDGLPGPWGRGCCLVYVDSILHVSPSDREGVVWEKKKSPKSVSGFVYVEEVKDVWLLVAKPKLIPQLIGAYQGSDLQPKENPTLLDRAFALERTGSGVNTMETLRELANSVITPEVIEARKNAPDLEEVILAEFASFKPRTVVARNTDDNDDLLSFGNVPSDEIVSFD